MPIEIKELVIRATLTENKPISRSNDKSTDNEAQIIAACVEQVLEILEKDKER